MLLTTLSLIVIVLASLIAGYLIAHFVILYNITGTILIDRTKSIDIVRIELDKPIRSTYSIFRNKEVTNLESASETYSIVEGGQQNG